MNVELIVAAAGSAVASSFLLTSIVRHFAISYGVLDVPNERSSHSMTTPRAGGIAIATTVTLSLTVLATLQVIETRLACAAIGGGTAVAFVGYLDDRYQLSAKLRLLVHFAAAAWAVLLAGGMPPLQIGSEVFHSGWVGDIFAATGIVWMLNLFNFMDGIDGIAASEGVFIACSGAALAFLSGGDPSYSLVGIVFGAGSLGFLLWNWPPAKIFMGDVGSGYMGYFVALLALADMRDDPAALWVWLILAGVFLSDASVTLLRRLLRGERVYEAHRSHAYQWLARRWGSHKKVTIAVSIVNLVWLLPCAIVASLRPTDAAWITLVALAPLLLMAVVAGSGRVEHHCVLEGEATE